MEYDDSSNLSACSQASSNLESWIYLENNLKLDEIDNYISKILPPSVAFQTNHSTYCLFCTNALERHQVKEQLRKCKLCNHFQDDIANATATATPFANTTVDHCDHCRIIIDRG
ncbi:hypothetical protein BpHYR1_016355 [Brachionus plicatilis]|uniref:Uncharacterized protein n=1 Tax=Brachionus plicatilis TaxID=10195 RepID=A0A3M7R0Z6_BRAPC|nr:hypothetical protein BpHYR1_016355 [Brachionus plicatilis]